MRKIFKTGHSAAVTISAKLLEALGLKLGDDVRVEINGDKPELVIRPGNRQSQLRLNLKIRPSLGSAAGKK